MVILNEKTPCQKSETATAAAAAAETTSKAAEIAEFVVVNKVTNNNTVDPADEQHPEPQEDEDEDTTDLSHEESLTEDLEEELLDDVTTNPKTADDSNWTCYYQPVKIQCLAKILLIIESNFAIKLFIYLYCNSLSSGFFLISERGPF